MGALGVIRVSGAKAFPVVSSMFPKKDLLVLPSHTLHYGPLTDGDHLLDEVVISLFRGPASFTGEDVIEISCHGSAYILQQVMQSLSAKGVRPAGPGEFTMRAFLNGRMDLAQAEAVADLICSETESAHRTALSQMRGGFSRRIGDLREKLLQFASLIELELDFAEEDVEFADRKALRALLVETDAEVRNLADSFRLGNVLKSGVKAVIAGRPNAGKSTLLNSLLNEERAIVSDIPGTTRDSIEDTVVIEGIQFRFIDTAGIRNTTDTLESIGISRTHSKMQEADVIIYLFDVSAMGSEDLAADLAALPQDKPLLVAANKSDLAKEESAALRHPGAWLISAKEGQGIDELKKALLAIMQIDSRPQADVIVTNIRHYHVLNDILGALAEIRTAMDNNLPSDLVAIDIRKTLYHMGEITGEITNDEILGNIFGKFCIGK
ncbi:MAG: tRNA uridine-5-carboxymethylaminomethyl(34) synthesis GTPase MnmE [Bacteroidota bacterium]|nr:tRNA uridine-5-carboxymethylaminomethyl(34) synthesis GTPase MnmE [Bacteroidota bacterium]